MRDRRLTFPSSAKRRCAVRPTAASPTAETASSLARPRRHGSIERSASTLVSANHLAATAMCSEGATAPRPSSRNRACRPDRCCCSPDGRKPTRSSTGCCVSRCGRACCFRSCRSSLPATSLTRCTSTRFGASSGRHPGCPWSSSLTATSWPISIRPPECWSRRRSAISRYSAALRPRRPMARSHAVARVHADYRALASRQIVARRCTRPRCLSTSHTAQSRLKFSSILLLVNGVATRNPNHGAPNGTDAAVGRARERAPVSRRLFLQMIQCVIEEVGAGQAAQKRTRKATASRGSFSCVRCRSGVVVNCGVLTPRSGDVSCGRSCRAPLQRLRTTSAADAWMSPLSLWPTMMIGKTPDRERVPGPGEAQGRITCQDRRSACRRRARSSLRAWQPP